MKALGGKELWLFTRQFPQGRGEAFLESALPVWAEHFERVRVIPMFEGPGRVQLPQGVEELRLWKDQELFMPLSLAGSVRSAVPLIRLLAQRGDGWSGSASRAREGISHVRQLMQKARVVEERLIPQYDPERVVLLSTWMEDWVTVLALVKQRYPRLRFTTLAHGWDLFEDRRASGRIPFRDLQVHAADKILCISDQGARYLQSRYPNAGDRISSVNLGTLDHGTAPWSPSASLRLVSCAYLRPPKRMDLLAKALCHMQRPVIWTHFGDGPDLAELTHLVAALPDHIQVDLRGAVGNAELMRWYQENPVDLFVHFSDHEGVPVSLMESASFGIPLMANDVGGVAQVVTSASGRLLPSSPDIEHIAAELEGFAGSPMSTSVFRSGVRRFWEDRFQARKNALVIMEKLSAPVT